jgi:hypothetical protein
MLSKTCKNWGCRSCVAEDWCLLHCDAGSMSEWFPTFWGNVGPCKYQKPLTPCCITFSEHLNPRLILLWDMSPSESNIIIMIIRTCYIQYSTHFWNLRTNELTNNWVDISIKITFCHRASLLPEFPWCTSKTPGWGSLCYCYGNRWKSSHRSES